MMNTDMIEGNWKQITGKVQQEWGKLTDNQINQINGSRKRLIGMIQKTYGLAQDDAEKQVDDWEDKLAA